MNNSSQQQDVCLVGHPYAPIGMGEHVRCTYRALRSVALHPTIADIYKLAPPTQDDLAEFSEACSDSPAPLNIFHINGDEVEQSLAHLSYKNSWNKYNIIYPAWELAKYPKEWATQLDRFDEIWASSRFIMDALQSSCTKPIIYMPQACEVVLSSFLSRRYFKIPESEYVFLFFFDLRSYKERKNPTAILEAFRKLLVLRPYTKTRLILKIHGAELDPQAMETLRQNLSDIISHVTFILHVMTDNEVKNLVRCCDCFISLHRSEGYGRGIAEAMYLGKPVIATAYSGNMDFMSRDTTMAVDYELVSVGKGEYPHWQDQVWANADIDQAVTYMQRLIDDPIFGQELGRIASAHIRRNFGYRTVGLRYRERLNEIADSIATNGDNNCIAEKKHKYA